MLQRHGPRHCWEIVQGHVACCVFNCGHSHHSVCAHMHLLYNFLKEVPSPGQCSSACIENMRPTSVAVLTSWTAWHPSSSQRHDELVPSLAPGHLRPCSWRSQQHGIYAVAQPGPEIDVPSILMSSSAADLEGPRGGGCCLRHLLGHGMGLLSFIISCYPA